MRAFESRRMLRPRGTGRVEPFASDARRDPRPVFTLATASGGEELFLSERAFGFALGVRARFAAALSAAFATAGVVGFGLLRVRRRGMVDEPLFNRPALTGRGGGLPGKVPDRLRFPPTRERGDEGVEPVALPLLPGMLSLAFLSAPGK